MPEIGVVGSQDGNVFIPRDYAMGGVLVGIPSFGMWSVEFANNLLQQSPPINFSMGYMTPKYCRWDWEKNEPYEETDPIKGRQIPVDEARNIIAHSALQNNMAYVFFRDDDVLCQNDTINRLFYHDVPIIAAPYWSKQKPPHSLILLEGKLAGWEDLSHGGLMECMATGMGATLIKVDVFREIDPPWFKTVHGLHMNDIQDIAPNCARMTEDVYFCKKAAAKGYKTLVDCSLPAAHQDFKEDTLYYFHPEWQIPVWQRHNVIEYIPPGNPEKGKAPPRPAPEVVTKDAVKIDMGCGPDKDEGYIRCDIDPKQQADLICPMWDFGFISQRYPFVEEVRCKDAFEHLPFGDVSKALGCWRKLLQPGGKLEIQVPDLKWACEYAIEHAEGTFDESYNSFARIFGHASIGRHMEHNWGYTQNSLKSLLQAFGFENVEVERVDCHHGETGELTQVSIKATCTNPHPQKMDPQNLSLDDVEFSNGQQQIHNQGEVPQGHPVPEAGSDAGRIAGGSPVPEHVRSGERQDEVRVP